MKTLKLLRHAKSDWHTPYEDDKLRGLNNRGHRDIARIAPLLSNYLISSQSILVSAAHRAQLTIQGIADKHSPENKSPLTWTVEESLYTFSMTHLLSLLGNISNDFTDICFVGHNPAFTELINYLVMPPLDNFPTCGFIEMKLQIQSWQDITEGCGKVSCYLTPKQIKKGQCNDIH